MAFLASHNLPTVGRFLYRYLINADGQKEEKERLIALITPKDLVIPEGKPAGKKEGVPGGLATQHTITSLKEIGVIEEDDGILRLGSQLLTCERQSADPNQFFRVVRRLLMSGESASEPWSHREGRWDTAGSRDFVRAVTWLLAQDALGAPLSWSSGEVFSDAEAIQAQQFRAAGLPLVISSSTNWEDFQRWASVLGFARQLPRKRKMYLAPDATIAIRDVLTSDLGEQLDSWLPLPQVLDQLYAALPVLGDGLYQVQLKELLGTSPDQTGRHGVASCVSQALLTMHEAGVAALERRSDAPAAVLSDVPTAEPFSHIRLTKVA